MDDTVDKTFGIRFKNGKFLIGNKIIKIQDHNFIIGNEIYVGTPDLWILINEKILQNMMKKITRDTKSCFTKPMCSIVIMILKIVIPELTVKKIIYPIW